jgi:hypothetical protein
MQAAPSSRTKVWAARQFIALEALDWLHDFFLSVGKRYMLVKGAYLAATGLGDSLSERMMCDVDIVVDESALIPVTDMLFDHLDIIPVRHCKDNYRPYESQCFLNSGNGKILLEIHSHLNFPERFHLPPLDLFHRGVQSDKFRWLPCNEDALILLLCHLLSNMAFTISPSIHEEISVLINREQFDRQKFWDIARTTGIEAFMHFVLRVHAKIYQKDFICRSNRIHPYADLLALLVGNMTCLNSVPGWIRRMFIEVPMVRGGQFDLLRRKLHG